MKLKKLRTKDDSYTFFNPDIDDYYHSTFGAVQESQFIYVDNGFKYINKKEIKLLEVGFGTGLNAILTFRESDKRKIKTIYHGLEILPIDYKDICLLNYHVNPGYKQEIIKIIHESPWEEEIFISNNILKKINSDIQNYSTEEKYDLIYFDAFASEKQENIWTYRIFQNMFNILNPGGILITYSVKGIVKRGLKEAGFIIKRLPGPPGKRHILRATKS